MFKKNFFVNIIFIVSLIWNFFFITDYIQSKKQSPTSPEPKVAGVSVTLKDNNVIQLSKSDVLRSNLEEIVRSKKGTYAISIESLTTNEKILINPRETFYAASLFKVPVAISILDGIDNERISFDTLVSFEETHRTDGSGAIQNATVGRAYAVSELLSFLIKSSDNTAQVMLMPLTTGKMLIKVMPNSNAVTVNHITDMFSRLYEGVYLSSEKTDYLVGLLSKTGFDNRIHVGLPTNVVFAHKIGNWPRSGSWHDCGLLLDDADPLVVCVMSKDTTYEDFLSVTTSVGRLITNQFDL